MTTGPGRFPSPLRGAKGRVVRSLGAAAAWTARRTREHRYQPGVTVLTVNWNALPFLRSMLDVTIARSPADTQFLVVDNASNDGSLAHLRALSDVRVLSLPLNVGHGVALDLGVALVDTEYLAVLDVDAFPISPDWLTESTTALERGAQIAGAHMHRNFIHPCFLVTRTEMLHRYQLTFRPVGALSPDQRRAPLFLDVGEALAQRTIVRFGGSQALHPFPITSARGPGMAGAVFGHLVYHNMYATQGSGKAEALTRWWEALEELGP